jgi:hypothetical protein
MPKVDVKLTEDQIKAIRRKINPDLLEELSLGDKLRTLRDLTSQTNGGLAQMLGENKRTFEAWVAGRYIPEGEQLKKVNAILIYAAYQYIKKVAEKKTPSNAFSEFPTIFRLLDFNDAMNVLNSYFYDNGQYIDFNSGKIYNLKKSAKIESIVRFSDISKTRKKSIESSIKL